MFALWITAALASAEDTPYDLLRARLADDFLVVDAEPGGSIPAGWRHDTLSVMKWADATIALGWYVGVLATEHRLKVVAGEDTSRTERDLALALAAVERLDLVAETGFPDCPAEPALNGFFVRDDVPSTYGEHFGITTVQSDWIDSVYLKEESQDQVHHLLMGLALTKRFVAESARADDGTGQSRALSAWAVELGMRILEWVEHDDWVIQNPACGKNVERGPAAGPLAPGLAATYRLLSDGLRDLPSAATYARIWEPMARTDHPAYGNVDNLHMTSVTAATGSGFGDETFAVLVALDAREDWVAYPLLHRAIHGPADGWDAEGEALLARAHEQLDELGADEPHGFPDGVDVPFGWTSWHRYIRGAEQAYSGDLGRAGQRYSGVDWLLLHNLVALVELPPEPDDTDAVGEPSCGCAASGGGAWSAGLVALAVAGRRRRAQPPPRAGYSPKNTENESSPPFETTTSNLVSPFRSPSDRYIAPGAAR